MESEEDGECKFVHLSFCFLIQRFAEVLEMFVLCRKQTVGLIVECGILF